jgi:hypothetical protein
MLVALASVSRGGATPGLLPGAQISGRGLSSPVKNLAISVVDVVSLSKYLTLIISSAYCPTHFVLPLVSFRCAGVSSRNLLERCLDSVPGIFCLSLQSCPPPFLPALVPQDDMWRCPWGFPTGYTCVNTTIPPYPRGFIPGSPLGYPKQQMLRSLVKDGIVSA